MLCAGNGASHTFTYNALYAPNLNACNCKPPMSLCKQPECKSQLDHPLAVQQQTINTVLSWWRAYPEFWLSQIASASGASARTPRSNAPPSAACHAASPRPRPRAAAANGRKNQSVGTGAD